MRLQNWRGGIGAFLSLLGIAAALYGSTLFLGFLSDDYVLARHALGWHIGRLTDVFFRPIAMLAWAVILHGWDSPVPLHALNVLVHGVNAGLATRVAVGWVPTRAWAWWTGLIVVAMPLAGEAVAWCSGLFDLLSTTFVLASVLLARRYARPRLDPWLRPAFVAAAGAALGCKETGAIACAIVALDAWALRYLNRRLRRDLAMLFTGALAVGVWRLSTSGSPQLELSRYALQRLLFNAFGSLAVPWRHDMAHGWLAAIQPVVVLTLAVSLALCRTARRGTLRLLVASAAWIVVPLIPAAALFFVGPSLEGSRYLYLSTIGWALFAAVLGSSSWPDATPLRWARATAAGAIAAALLVGAVVNLAPWHRASRLRNGVEAAFATAAPRSEGAPPAVCGLPDSVSGAYVFRNGLVEAFERDLRMAVRVASSGADCDFRWDGGAERFLP